MTMRMSVTKTRKPPLSATTPGGLVLNKKDLRSFKEIAYDNQNVEYLYLRENEFFNFDPYVTLPKLKVLDLSINNLTGTVNFLPSTPNLRHLYLTGNRINSLEGLAGIPTLETLCLSDNDISSFEGLDNLPNLRVLSLNFNNIANYRHYPFLPELHTLNMIGNPIAEVPAYRQMAIAASSPTLVSMDTKPVTPEEQLAVQHYAGKLVYCVTEGLVIEGDQPEEQAEEFLLKLQRETWQNGALALQNIIIHPSDGSAVLTEGKEVKLSLCLQDTRPLQERRDAVFRCPSIHPVQFKVVGDATEVFVVGEMNRWQDPIPLERAEDAERGEVYFHTTLYLPVGDYEYRYIIDGEQSVDADNQKTSKYDQGICNVYKVVDPEKSAMDPADTTILYVRWMRCNTSNGFDVIENQNGLTYMPTQEDIGVCLRAEVLAYTNSDFSFLYFDISSPIAPGPPSCASLEFGGSATEGDALTVDAVYIGGEEGASTLQWFRIHQDGTEELVDAINEDPWNPAGYTCTLADVGKKIKVEYTPVRNDSEVGEKAVKVSDAIRAGLPTCRSLKVEGEPMQDQLLTCLTTYSGGYEGNSIYQWYRLDAKTNEYFAIPGENRATYTPQLMDVKTRLAVEYTPVSETGTRGETNRCPIEALVQPAPPSLKSLKITGHAEEQHVLLVEYQYSGGYYGVHNIQWWATDESLARPTPKKVGKANSPTLTLTASEVGHRIEVEFTPVRDDGVKGQAVRQAHDSVVKAAAPQLRAFSLEVKKDGKVVDTATAGCEVKINAEYFGGKAGKPEITWSKSTGGSGEFEKFSVDTLVTVLGEADVGSTIKVEYTPVREDGERGATKMRLLEVPKPAAAHADPAAPAA